MSEPIVTIESMCKTIESRDGSQTEVSRDVSFTLNRGEFVSIVGPSGAGKTTLLRVVAGLSRPTSGEIRYQGKPVTDVPDSLSIVFQDYNKSLFPWLSVSKNVAMGARRLDADEVGPRVRVALERVGLAGFESRYPWELSGGMQQRAALARALVSDPKVLLLDEPLASVDALTRSRLEDLILELWKSEYAALLVTHDVAQAVYLSDRILVMSARPSTVIEQITVDLPRPRAQHNTRALPEFVALQERVLQAVLNPDPVRL